MNLNEITLTYAGEKQPRSYTQDFSFTYKGESYKVTLSWHDFDGFDLVDGWQVLPNELSEDFLELAEHLDILAFQADFKAGA